MHFIWWYAVGIVWVCGSGCWEFPSCLFIIIALSILWICPSRRLRFWRAECPWGGGSDGLLWTASCCFRNLRFLGILFFWGRCSEGNLLVCWWGRWCACLFRLVDGGILQKEREALGWLPSKDGIFSNLAIVLLEYAWALNSFSWSSLLFYMPQVTSN